MPASYYFYMCWSWQYIFLIVGITIIDYTLALLLEKTDKRGKRRAIMATALITNLGLLFYYKYFNFALESTEGLLQILGIPQILPRYDILLPVGISFFTFQALAYFFDVYTGKRKAEHHLGYFALFVSFFPQLVAGPIERSTNLLPQFFEKHKFNYDDAVQGLRLAAWGMFKKIVVADRAAEIVNSIYNSPYAHSGWSLILATVVFAFQIFCDFSGYSDIAIGVGRVMGFRLRKNFNRPYSAKSVADFWRRWHISLSTWFKDYVYIPLGGSRVTMARWAANALVVFLLSGLWHGADWTFVIWGAMLGAWQVLGRFTEKIRKVLWKVTKLDKIPYLRGAVSIIITFAFICFSWIFFRANSLADANFIISHLFTGLTWVNFKAAITSLGRSDMLILALSILAMEFGQWVVSKKYVGLWKTSARWVAYVGLIAWIFIFAHYGSQEFIYFQF
ncbi:alginate O-acetyltransferase [Clostridia bacterium]|nr:alginate O-acetyltransferase [Clostridia bacterium]